ncbi:MAG TPA: hypothetical protein DCX00_07270 [Flavobacteriales bacterium]|nr:hypothetical protein [Flavobacteriales bacterium]
MRTVHSFFMTIYDGLLRLASSCGHKKAKGWTKMRSQGWLVLAEATNALLPGEQWHAVHCASVGEFEQARPVMEAYRKANPPARFLLTFFSPSGWNAFDKQQPEWWTERDCVAPSPLDRPRYVRQFLAAATREEESTPAIAWLALAKYEVWPLWLAALQKKKVPCVVFAAHAVEGRWPFRLGGAWHRKAWGKLDAIWVQHEQSKETLSRWGISGAKVMGDPRFDRVLQTVQESTRHPDEQLMRWVDSRTCVVVGSAWKPETESMLAVNWPENTCVIVVPHEWSVGSIMAQKEAWEKRGLKTTVWSDHRSINTDAALPPSQVLIVDAMGFLTRIYAVANAAVVGGGFGEGIHNTLEPAAHGVSIWVGPNCGRFLEAQLLESSGGLQVVTSETALTAAVQHALLDVKVLKEKGLHAQSFARANAGSAQRIASGLLSL